VVRLNVLRTEAAGVRCAETNVGIVMAKSIKKILWYLRPDSLEFSSESFLHLKTLCRDVLFLESARQRKKIQPFGKVKFSGIHKTIFQHNFGAVKKQLLLIIISFRHK